ncbi:MAG: hypothetical protein WBN68_11215 [Sedimenticolaceae bacterium]
MHHRRSHRRPNPVAFPPGRLREEIAALEKRLDTLGPDGDCGYENAMIRFYEQELVARRALLNASE